MSELKPSAEYGPVLNPLKSVAGLLLLLVAGCASGPVASKNRAPDWSSAHPTPLTIDRTGLFTNAPNVPALKTLPASAVLSAVLTTAPTAAPDTWVSLGQWCREHGFAQPLLSTGSLEYAVRSSEGTFVLQSGTTLAHWQGVELHLGYAPVLINREPFVHPRDLQSTLLPLLGRQHVEPHAGKCVIVLDPGHGGHDSGTKSSSIADAFEKEFTLDWARRVAGLLSSAGCEVVLTHANDADLSLSNRVAFADTRHASLFVSFHFNSGPGGAQTGVETYCLTPSGMPSSFNRGYEDDPDLVFPNNQFDAANLQLACCLQQALLQVEGARDRGVRRARFLSVLRAQPRPAVLVEGGYLSNPAEARRIASPEHRQHLAEAVANALQSWLGQNGFVLSRTNNVVPVSAAAGGAAGP